MTEIVADFDHMMEEAGSTAARYMTRARFEIDKQFGEGYADKNPALVAAFMQTAAADFGVMATAKVIGQTLEEIAGSLREIAHAVEDLEPR